MAFNNLWILVLIVPLIFLVISEKYGGRKENVFPLANAKVKKHNYSRFNYDNQKIKHALFVIGLFCLIISAAGPQFGTKVKEVERQGVDLVIAFDTSVSMDAQDIKPSRIEKAKFEISRLIQSLSGDRVAMIVFAGTSHLYLPLTTDYEAALLFLNAIDTKMIPNQGTSISSAMNKAIDIVSLAEQLRIRIKENAALIRENLDSLAIPYLDTNSHIVAVLINDPFLCKKVSKDLIDDHGIYAQPIFYPTVPKGLERLRITVTPKHRKEHIEKMITALDKVWSKNNLPRKNINKITANI